jgi:hypothetical protein
MLMKNEESNRNTQQPIRFVERNVITKYAFATRVGFIPNNPNK